MEIENRKDYWICPNIIVKIKNKDVLDGKLYKRKAVITSVQDKYLAFLKVLDSGTELGLDQDDLETVVPSKDKQVLIVNGAYRNEVGKVLSINIDKYNCNIEILTGQFKGNFVELPYEDFCQVYKTLV